MTPRERLLATLRGQLADRVPVAPFVQDEYLAYYYPRKSSVDRVIDATELAEEFDFDLMAKHRALEAPHFLRHSHPNWELRHSETRDGQMIRRKLEIVEAGKPGGRFIFSTSDYLEVGTPRENVVAMIEAAKEAGRY